MWALIIAVDDVAHITTITKQFIKKMKLISNIHENVLLNVEMLKRNKIQFMLREKGNKHLKDWLLDE